MNEERFVIDTNVLVSALIFSNSKPRQALDKVLDVGILLLSESIFLELKAVLLRPKFDRYVTLEKRTKFLDNLAEITLFIEPDESINDCRDPKDNKYLELAVSGKVNCLITGDEDLLVLNPFRGISILTVQLFLESFRKF
ncbi:MAG: putative toxin-antitoxin system toxin component, PIN family [Coleofasciculaceae cyanobacterium SM2_1_6]|nr:putative toxin-antitoxin system toxin component, PIN family [Coleofasciculaceae cyanobacterium SM2_1_6]